jgi:hypothetical protein
MAHEFVARKGLNSLGPILSGGTNLYDIFTGGGGGAGDVTRVQPGTYISTGGTPNYPTVNLATDINLTTMSAATIYSGSTDLSYILAGIVDTTDVTRVQPGANINTGGTENLPVINLDADIVLTSVEATTLSGGTIFSGGTDLSDLFARFPITASDVSVNSICPTQSPTVQNLHNSTLSAGKFLGFTITSGSTGGAVNISSGTGLIKSTDSLSGETYVFCQSGATNLNLANLVSNHIFVDYSGGTPTISTNTTNNENGTTRFNIGRVFREGDVVNILTGGRVISLNPYRISERFLAENTLKRTSGLLISETGTRNVGMSEGIGWHGIQEISYTELDTAVSDSFESYYYDGADWIESAATQIDNIYYNNIATGLETLTVNKYGVHWVYLDFGGKMLVVYGQGDYTITEAQDAESPSSLPPHASDFSILLGKIIIQQGAAVFVSIESAFEIDFVGSSAPAHNELGGLQGGTTSQYYHQTQGQWFSANTLQNVEIGMAISDEATPLTAVTFSATTFHLPYAMTATSIFASVRDSGPRVCIFDVLKNGVPITNASRITINSNQYTTLNSPTGITISSGVFAAGDKVSFSACSVNDSNTGGKMWLFGTRYK